MNFNSSIFQFSSRSYVTNNPSGGFAASSPYTGEPFLNTPPNKSLPCAKGGGAAQINKRKPPLCKGRCHSTAVAEGLCNKNNPPPATRERPSGSFGTAHKGAFLSSASPMYPRSCIAAPHKGPFLSMCTGGALQLPTREPS